MATEPDAAARSSAPSNSGDPPPAAQAGLLQRRWMQNLLSWTGSLAAHVAIIVLATAMVVVVNAPPQIARQEQVLIPEAARTVQSATMVPNLGNESDVANTIAMAEAAGGGSGGPPIGPALASSDGAKGFGEPAPLGRGVPGDMFPGSGGKRDGGRGGLFPGGPGRGGIGGPKNAIFVPGGNARRVVFVCDASGSMINKFATLKEQLNRVISKMRIPQSFDVIFFQDNRAIVLSRDALHHDSLILASADGRRNASAFLESLTIGQTSDPMQALRLAFSRKPDLLYFLTDGDFPDNDAVLKNVRMLNQPDASGRKVKINTIAFFDNDRQGDDGIRVLLQRIASENDGSFNEVTESQIEDK
jgi:hypothetical protein